MAREFYPMAMGHRICQAACQLGHTIGLYRKLPHCPRGLSAETQADGKRLYSILYSTDKQRALMMGQPCDMYLFESEIDLTCDSGDDASIMGAFAHMMTIWEEIYLSLCCQRALSSSYETRRSQIQSIADLISRWNQRFTHLMDPIPSEVVPEPSPFSAELKYCYHITQVLLLRCDSQDDNAMTQLREHARRALKLTTSFSSTPPTKACLASHGSMFQNYPIVAWVDIIFYHVTVLSKNSRPDPEAEADIALLWTVRQQLEAFQHPDLPDRYYTRLYKGLSWACDILCSLKGLVAKSKPARLLDPSEQSPAEFSIGSSSTVDGSTASLGCGLRSTEPSLGAETTHEGVTELTGFQLPFSMTGYHGSTLASLLSMESPTSFHVASRSTEHGSSALDFIRGNCLLEKWGSM